MSHTFPRKAFRNAELLDRVDMDEALLPLAEKVAQGLNEHDLSAVEAGGGKLIPFASLEQNAYYAGYEAKASIGMALNTGLAYATPNGVSVDGNTATVLDTQEWQGIVDDVTGAALSKGIGTGEDILFICACVQSAGWSGALGVTPTLVSLNEYRLQYALRVDGVVYEDTITGPAYAPDPPPQQIYSGVKAVLNTEDFDYRHKGWQQNGTGLPNHLQPARLTRAVPVVEGNHTVEVVCRRMNRADGKVDNSGTGSSMQVFNRRLFILRIKGFSKFSGSGAPTLALAPWSEGDVFSNTNIMASRVTPIKNALNDVVDASIQRGALHNEHLPTVVAFADVATLNPAAAVLRCTGGTANTYAGFGAAAGWHLVNDGAGNNLRCTGPGGAGFVLTANPGVMVVMANVQVRRIRDPAGSIEARYAGVFILSYMDNGGTQRYVAETEMSITPRNQTSTLPSAAGGGATFTSNYGVDQNYCEEDVALLWVFDTAVFLAAHPLAATMQNIEVVCATCDTVGGVILVEMETQKATLSVFMLKGVGLI